MRYISSNRLDIKNLDKKDFYNIPSKFDLTNEDDCLLLEELMTGGLVKTIIHEISHDMYNIYYYHSNGTISLKAPRKVIDGENLRETGEEIEILLFGENITSINIKQVMYLLNEQNFSKGILEFRNGFKELKSEELGIEGEFSGFNKITKFKHFNTSSNFSISTSGNNNLLSMKIDNDNDAI